MATRDEVVKALAVTAEICGATEFSDAAKYAIVQELAAYAPDAVLTALAKCRREVKGRLSLAEIVSRIDDGRPGVEAAWGMVRLDEGSSFLVTREMSIALGVAWRLIDDPIAARMAFKEAYTKEVSDARVKGIPVEWTVSVGWDRAGRDEVVKQGIIEGKLPQGAYGIRTDTLPELPGVMVACKMLEMPK